MACRMRRSSIVLLLAALAGAADRAAADDPYPRVGASASERPDLRAGTVTRPANGADRAWRRGRSAPEIVLEPRRPAPTARARALEAPRYDGRGRRLNVPGRPDTYDAIGRIRALSRPAPRIAPSGPVVRSDAATRINQFPPR
jgi:hypothetical protein